MYRTVILLTAFSTLLLSQRKNFRNEPPGNPSGVPNAALLNINRISSWYQSNGTMGQHPMTGNSGVTYPRSTATSIFSAGLLWGGFVNDSAMSPTVPRVNGNAYNAGLTPGAINGMRTGITEDPVDEGVRLFRVRRDFMTADLKLDAAETNSIDTLSIDSTHINALRNQYKKDWLEWPAAKGAPFYDADLDGKYQPKFELQNGKEIPVLYPYADEPGIASADQVIWYVANDIRGGDSPYKSKPIGLEVQVTIWGYNAAGNRGEGNAIFHRHRLIFKGTSATPDIAKITEFYIGQWSDPDLGDYGDDVTGCDSVLSAGFVYNSAAQDNEYAKYQLSPPAVGYILMQGPTISASTNEYARYNFEWKKGFTNLPATSFVPMASAYPGCSSDPPFSINLGYQFYQNLRGLPSTPLSPPDPSPFINPVTNKLTKFVASGDPVSGSGWIDGPLAGNLYGCHVSTPGDRRMLLSAGPITMSLGDTQEVVFAIVGAVGSDRLASITAMKFFMKQVREHFHYLFPDNPNAVTADQKPGLFQFLLDQNYPNPFNSTTKITFTIRDAAHVTLTVFDLLGRKVAELINETKPAGIHIAEWDGLKNDGIPAGSGVYIYQLSSRNYLQSKRMIMLK